MVAVAKLNEKDAEVEPLASADAAGDAGVIASLADSAAAVTDESAAPSSDDTDTPESGDDDGGGEGDA